MICNINMFAKSLAFVNQMYYEITNRTPTFQEANEYSSSLYLNNSHHNVVKVYDEVLERHIKEDEKVMFLGDGIGTCKVDLKELQSKRMLVCGMVKDISGNIHYLKDLITNLRKYLGCVCFYFYHNNSKDNSVDILKRWIAEDNNISGTFADNIIITVLNADGKPGNRIPQFAKIRNTMITQAISYFGKNFDYMLMTNTDFVGDVDVKGIIKSLGFNLPWDIICGNCCFQNSYYHYDTFALRLLDDEDDIRELYPDFDKYYGRSAAWNTRLYRVYDWVKVKAGYGDMCLINFKKLLDVFPNNKMLCDETEETPHICELISMCKKFKDVYVSPHIMYPATIKVEGSLYKGPYMFIPRDAGFFSVFNFYMGLIAKGVRAYPYYNREWFMKQNKENRHFCYWTNADNAWFDYFEPMKFYYGDVEHKTKAFLNYEINNGSDGTSGTFRNHHTYDRMMRNTAAFKIWRHKVHQVFKHNINIRKSILETIDTFWQNIPTNNVIGVHYRHPSHYVESGHLFFKYYFDEVDKLLEATPDAHLYIASDNELGIIMFKNKYGVDKVHYWDDVDRVSVDNILEWAFAKSRANAKSDGMDFIDGRGFQLHYTKCQNGDFGAKAGVDVLKEAVCLSRCKWFINSVSNIALAVSYMNPEVEMVFVDGKRQ